jgi:cobalt-zinc-cadmium efflux system outer membrane protein
VGFVLASCATYEPAPLEPSALYEDLQQRGTTTLSDAAPQSPSPWFPLASVIAPEDGLTLAEANTLALIYSPAIRAVRLRAKTSRVAALYAGLLENPELSLGPQISTRTNELIFPISLSWQLPLFGQVEAEREALGAAEREQLLEVVLAEFEVLKDIREKFLRAASLKSQIEALDQAQQELTKLLVAVEALVALREADAVLLFLVRTEQETLEVERMERVADLRTVERDLRHLLGLLPDASVAFETESPDLPTLEPSELLPSPLLRLPKVQRAAFAYEVAEAELRHEITKQFPAITLGPSGESDRGEGLLGIGLGITLPFFQRNQGGIAKAETARDGARLSYQDALLAATHEADAARAQYEAARERIEHFRNGPMKDVDAVVAAMRTQEKAGRFAVLERISAERAMTDGFLRLLKLEEQVLMTTFDWAYRRGQAFAPGTTAFGQELLP